MAASNYYGGSLPEPPGTSRMSNQPSDGVYEEVSVMNSSASGNVPEFADPNEASAVSTSNFIPTASENYPTTSSPVNRGIRHQSESNYEYNYTALDPAERHYKVYDNMERITNGDAILKKNYLFKTSPTEFIDSFESTKDEIRANEETFIIVHLLGKSSNKSPALEGRLDHLAMLACCNSRHVVKRALDILLNEIFLSISDIHRNRCYNILQAEEILRNSLPRCLKIDHVKAKCHRLTTYAWLITFVLLKCNIEEFIKIQPKIKQFDKVLDTLQKNKENNERNNFRYGIYLARESIKRIIQSCGKKDSSNSLKMKIKKCENILSGKLEENEVTQLGRTLIETEGSWIDFHVCLVFLQDLPKFYEFQGDKKPVILIQMLVADYRERCASTKYERFLKHHSNDWLFEVLVYHVMLRLIRTSPSKAITEQVLSGPQGCGGILKEALHNKSKITKRSEQVISMHLKKLCRRAVFFAEPNIFNQFITDNSSGNEKRFIEELSIHHLSSSYKDKIFEILQESRLLSEQQSALTYDCLLSGRKCLLKLHYHSKEELLQRDALETVPLKNEIKILKVLNDDVESTSHVVKLFGSSIEAPMHMIIERMPKTDLLSYLQERSIPPQARVMFKISVDICTAMMYLGKCNVIHRDLRAKNCFVFFHEGNVVTKLGDFHLAIISHPAPISQSTSPRPQSAVPLIMKGSVPKEFALRWMAIEALQFGTFSPASDVWSFGILLSEIFTFGCKPYTNMPSGISLEREEEVREFILAGKRLELHPKIPEKIKLLIKCTMMDENQRPTFSCLKDSIMNIMENNTEDEPYYDPMHYKTSQNDQLLTSPKRINPRSGCNVDGCMGDCVNALDFANRAKIEVRGMPVDCIKEFVSGSPDIVHLLGNAPPSLATIFHAVVHVDKVELVTEGGDMTLEKSIKKYRCSEECAMTYLSNITEAISFLHSKSFIHRNLRASSVFISRKRAKLGCFARVKRLELNPLQQPSSPPVYVSTPPDDSLRWSSPEVISDGKYSKASDVWAFGVLVWEMFTLMALHKEDGSYNEVDDKSVTLPYNHLASKEQIMSYLEKKNRLERPQNCPEQLYEKIRRCWEYDADDRPKCEEIIKEMGYYCQPVPGNSESQSAAGTMRQQADEGRSPLHHKVETGCSDTEPRFAHPVSPVGSARPLLNQPRYRVLYEYTALDEDEISIVEGDIIVDANIMDSGWMEGKNQRTGQSGMIPSNYTEKIENN